MQTQANPYFHAHSHKRAGSMKSDTVTVRQGVGNHLVFDVGAISERNEFLKLSSTFLADKRKFTSCTLFERVVVTRIVHHCNSNSFLRLIITTSARGFGFRSFR